MTQGSETIQPGTVLAGRYRVDRRLGEGGMGSVFLVEHVHTDQKLAVKILHSAVVKDAAALDRFRREARTPARINSDHVVQVTDADVAPELGGVPFLVMEWLRGQDLGQISESRGALPPRDVIVYLQQAARALDKAHGMGIVHRDLKPENLFLTTREDGAPFVKLLDFGIAKLTGPAGDLASVGSVTSTGQIFGTPLYMSPEQAKAEQSKISPRTDIWALGLIAHRLLMGADFWTAETLTHLLAQIAYEPIPPPSERGAGFGKAYDAWFLKCCARDPEARYASAGEAIVALADALGVADAAGSTRISLTGASSSAPAPLGFTPSRSGAPIAFAETALGVPTASPTTSASLTSPSRGRLRLGIGAAGALALLAVAVWLMMGKTPSPTAEDPNTTKVAGAMTAAPEAQQVTVTPSPLGSSGAQAAAPPAAPTQAPPAAPTRPEGPPEKTDPKATGTRPPVAGSLTAKPAVTAAPTATAVAAPPKPTGDPENPLESRH